MKKFFLFWNRSLRVRLSAVFRGRKSGGAAKLAVKRTDIVVPDRIGDLGDGARVAQQKLFRGLNTQHVKIAVEVDADFVAEKMRNVKAADAELPRQRF